MSELEIDYHSDRENNIHILWMLSFLVWSDVKNPTDCWCLGPVETWLHLQRDKILPPAMQPQGHVVRPRSGLVDP